MSREPAAGFRARWLSRRSLGLHALLAVWVPGCLVAGWWQVTVALGGDHLAYLYSVEWPVFAVFGLLAWWHLLHDDPETVGVRGLRRARAEAEAAGTLALPLPAEALRHRDEEDEELASYNDYLAGLMATGRPKTWRRT